ncbi:MAG: tetratricopeptide repeat protein [Xanthomonadales bacterium]|nr:tetratricopeptide repeat protein [Xanthomonadales bacterium]
MKKVPCVFIFVMFFLTACSTVQESPLQTVAESESAPVESASTDGPVADLPETDTDVMYHVFSAEVLGTDGDVSGAAAAYLEAALKSEDPEVAERASRIAVSAGEWQMLALASDRWAMLDPTSLDARELAAGSRLREGDYAGAEFQLAKILELTADDQELGWQVVISLLAPVEDRARANKILDRLLQEFDGESNVSALFARSRLAASFGDVDEAFALVDQAIKREPERADLLAWSGRLAVNLGDETLALSRYQQAWEASPENERITMSYAELLKRNNNLTAAQEVLAQLPDTPDMRFARIIFALDGGDRSNAELLYAGFSTAQYEDISEAAFQAAQSAELLDYRREAIDWYAQVNGEKSTRAIMRRAFLLAALGDIEESRNLLMELRTKADAETRSRSFQAEAQILQESGNMDVAFEILNDGLESLPEDIELRYARALMAVGLGKLELAESDLRWIISIQPDNAAAINALGYTLADLTERYDEAEELILLAYELQPEDASIIDSMGWIAYRLGRLAEAEAYMREAWKIMRNAEVAAHLGEVLWARGQKDEARSTWKLGLQLENDNEILINTMQRFGESP